MLALVTHSLLCLLHAPLPPSARSAVMRTPAVRAVAAADPQEKVVGQVAGSNPTDTFAGSLYDRKKDKEIPPVWGGLSIGTKKLVVITGVRAPPAQPHTCSAA